MAFHQGLGDSRQFRPQPRRQVRSHYHRVSLLVVDGDPIQSFPVAEAFDDPLQALLRTLSQQGLDRLLEAFSQELGASL